MTLAPWPISVRGRRDGLGRVAGVVLLGDLDLVSGDLPVPLVA